MGQGGWEEGRPSGDTLLKPTHLPLDVSHPEGGQERQMPSQEGVLNINRLLMNQRTVAVRERKQLEREKRINDWRDFHSSFQIPAADGEACHVKSLLNK